MNVVGGCACGGVNCKWCSPATSLPLAPMPIFYPATTGWSCPKCNRIYGPMVQECGHCNNSFSSIGGTVKG